MYEYNNNYYSSSVPGHNKEKLHETRTEGQDASQHAGDRRIEVPGLLGDLAGDVAGDHWELQGILLIAEVSTKEH